MKPRLAAAVLPAVVLAAVWLLQPAPRDAVAPTQAPPRAPAAPQAGTSPSATPAALPAAARAAAAAAFVTFDSAPDLYALANAALASSDPLVQINRWQALLTCMWTPSTRAQYEAMAASGPGDAVLRERQRAAQLILRRCTGFFNNDPVANDGLRRRLRELLREQVQRQPNLVVPGLKQGETRAAQVADAVQRGNAAALPYVNERVLPIWRERSGFAVEADGAQMQAIGALTAMCDLGQDCSPEGLQYAIYCVQHSICPGSWAEFNKLELSTAQQQQVRRWRDEYVAAFRRRDLAWFGVGR